MRRLAAAAVTLLLLGATPAGAADAGRCPEPGTGRVVHCRHTVVRGEWLWSIARTNLRQDFGQRRPSDRAVHRRADEIRSYNPGVDGDHLRPGQVLRLYPWVDAPTAPAGPLDRSFGSQGLATVVPGRSYADARGVAIDGQGRILTAGLLSGSFVVARFTPDGQLDAAFGGGGLVRTAIGTWARAEAVVVQPDGRILVAGTTNPTLGRLDADVVVARYLPTGALDTSFGRGGIAQTSLPGPAHATAMALDAVGRVVVVGSTTPDEQSTRADVFLLRHLPDGTLDPTFGTAGRVVTDVAGGIDVAEAVAVAPDGRIVLSGTAGRGPEQGDQDALVARYLPTGNLDPTFGGDGTVTTSRSPFDSSAGVQVLADGRIVTAGTTIRDQVQPLFVLTRFGPDGAVLGLTTTDAGPEASAHALTVARDGGFVAVGRAANVAAVVRYDGSGRATDVVRTSFGGDRSGAFAVTIDAAGRTVVAGCTCDGSNVSGRGGFELPSSIVVARYQL